MYAATADAQFGPLPGASRPVATAPAAAAPASAGGADDAPATGAGARPKTATPALVDRSALLLLIAMVAAAIFLTQVTVRGELEVST